MTTADPEEFYSPVCPVTLQPVAHLVHLQKVGQSLSLLYQVVVFFFFFFASRKVIDQSVVGMEQCLLAQKTTDDV